MAVIENAVRRSTSIRNEGRPEGAALADRRDGVVTSVLDREMCTPHETADMFGEPAEKGTVWARHSNPKSGWSRMIAGFVAVGALYRRNWRVLGLTVLFLVINPVLFREPPEGTDDWMYKVVKAEERWTSDGNSLVGLGYPQVLNTVSIPVGLYGLYAAYKRKPISTVVFTLASQGLNQWCMKEIIDHYEEVDSRQAEVRS